jgi:YaiO family outer membrane protein
MSPLHDFIVRATITATIATVTCVRSAQAEQPTTLPPVPPSVLTASVSHEGLSNGQASWQDQSVGLQKGFAPRSLWEIGARRAQRFGLRDSEFNAGLTMPLSQGWNGSVAATYSADSRFFAHARGTLQLTRSLSGGWDLHGQWQRRVYDAITTNTLGAGVDKYVGDWRYAALLTYGRSNIGPIGTVARFQVDRDFGDRAKLSAIATVGRELDSAKPGSQAYRVNSYVLFGVLPMTAKWSLRGELGTHQLGDLYRRTGGRLGVEYIL